MNDPTLKDLHEEVRATMRRMKEAPRTSKLGRIRQRAKTRLSETYTEDQLDEKPQELQ